LIVTFRVASCAHRERLQVDEVAQVPLGAACMVNCNAAASSGLLGANTICGRPLPKSGRYALPGIGKQQLLDHVADMVVAIGRVAVRPRASK
jgi:hypothetical protein